MRSGSRSWHGLLVRSTSRCTSCTRHVLLTARLAGPRGHLLEAVASGVAFTALITVGTGLVTHDLKNANQTYGAFGA